MKTNVKSLNDLSEYAHMYKPPVRWWRSIGAYQNRKHTDTDQGVGIWMEIQKAV